MVARNMLLWVMVKPPPTTTLITTHKTHLCNTTYCYSTYQYETITSRSRQLLMMGTWLPETCCCGWWWNHHPQQPSNHAQPTHSETYLCNSTYCHSTYQHETIISRSRQLLMMGTWVPETCWATSRRQIKNTKVTLVGFSYPQYII